ncbi:unnamed protein product [Sphagnum balticum]
MGRRRPTKSQWRWRRGLSPHLLSPASGKAYARDSSALFLHARGPGDHRPCFFSSQLLRKWATVSYCIADSYGRPSACAYLRPPTLILMFLLGLRIPKKVRRSVHLCLPCSTLDPT